MTKKVCPKLLRVRVNGIEPFILGCHSYFTPTLSLDLVEEVQTQGHKKNQWQQQPINNNEQKSGIMTTLKQKTI